MNKHPQIPDSPLFIVNNDGDAIFDTGIGCRSLNDFIPKHTRVRIARVAALEHAAAGRPDLQMQWTRWGKGLPWLHPQVPPNSPYFPDGEHFAIEGEAVSSYFELTNVPPEIRKLVAAVAIYEFTELARNCNNYDESAAYSRLCTEWQGWIKAKPSSTKG